MRRLLLVLAIACATPTEPGAIVITPEPVFATLWAQVEQCSGRSRPMGDIAFYELPGVLTFAHKGQAVAGYYRPPSQIVMGEYSYALDSALRHEMLHAILNTVDHPHEFTQECATLVTKP
jgi:hypothetical protein